MDKIQVEYGARSREDELYTYRVSRVEEGVGLTIYLPPAPPSIL